MKIAFRPKLVTNIAVSGTVNTPAYQVSTGIQEVRLVSTVDAYVKISAGAIAATTTNAVFIPAGIPEYFIVHDGAYVSVIGATSTAGNLNVTELSR
jgi:hypothetical protein